MQQPHSFFLLVRQQDSQNGFLDMQTVFRFGEDLIGVLFKDCRRDLLAAVRGQTMKQHCVRLGPGQQLARDLKSREIAQTALALRCAGGGVPCRRLCGNRGSFR